MALGGRYRLVRQIAVGGMGEVWEAYDDSLARPVAVKVLRAEFAGDAAFLERFRTEARNSAALSHHNIAQLFDYGEQDGSSYLVMELVVGEPLDLILEREPVLPARRLLPLLAQTARGLHAAHVAGVVHRDVKPGNLLVTRGGRVKITDFGVSHADNQKTMTATGMVMGTAQYLSPEQAVGRPATPLSDLYSVGVIAYEALAGKRPFTGPTAVDIAVAHVNEPVPPLPTTVDPALAALVMRLLSKDPAARPASGEELAGLLDALVPQTPPAGVPQVVAAAAIAAAARPSVPPSYPPRRARRTAGSTSALRTAPARTRTAPAPQPAAGTRAAVRAAGRRRSPVTWGIHLGRLGTLTWPLLALLLLLVALLGAALADRLTRAAEPGPDSPAVAAAVDGPATPADPPTRHENRTAPTQTTPTTSPLGQYPRRGPANGMITVDTPDSGLATEHEHDPQDQPRAGAARPAATTVPAVTRVKDA